MIVQAKFKLEEDGWELVRTYSSKGVKIRQDGTGELYDEAIDPVRAERIYTEIEIPIAESSSDVED